MKWILEIRSLCGVQNFINLLNLSFTNEMKAILAFHVDCRTAEMFNSLDNLY